MVLNLPKGQILDEKYRVIRKLGQGGFGSVYQAEDLLIEKRFVAIKAVHSDEAVREEIIIREMNHLAALADPNVVTFHHHFRLQGQLFIVMEYCSRGSLWDVIAAEGPIAPDKVAGWGVELCEAIHRVHESGIVHHDLKPENILVGDKGGLKVADFGVANTLIGTRVYMAPELLVPGEHVSRTDRRADVYALGITLIALAHGAIPFSSFGEGRSLAAKIRMSFVPPDLPEWFKEVLIKAVHATPELRFQTMQEFAEALGSRYVPYVFNRKRIQAHKAAERAKSLLKRGKAVRGLKLCNQALHLDPACLEALIVAGRCELILKRVEKAEGYFERAVHINPRARFHKELGWIYLEKGKYPEAIAMLNDYLQRNASDWEAYALLAKVFYLTNRYEAAIDLIETVLSNYKVNSSFENNMILCQILLDNGSIDLASVRFPNNPFLKYNYLVYTESPCSWDHNDISSLKPKLIFQDYRFGALKIKNNNNLVLQEIDKNGDGESWPFNMPIVCLGRSDKTNLRFSQQNVSRRHCAIINFCDDVWVHDLGSTQGTYIDGEKIKKPFFVERRHTLSVGGYEMAILPKESMLI